MKTCPAPSAGQLLIFALALFALAGCTTFKRLKHEVASLDNDIIYSGVIHDPQAGDAAIYAMLYDGKSGATGPAGHIVEARDGRFVFMVPPSSNGGYKLLAFRDEDGNAHWSPGEPFRHENEPLDRPSGKTGLATAELVLDDPAPEPPEAALTAWRSLQESDNSPDLPWENSIPVAVGEVSDLGDPRFTAEAGLLGFWQPATFLRQHGVGVVFLQDYDPAKLPVLYIHGATGSPLTWKHLVGQLDTKRFQPWVFYYPSGVRLTRSADALNRVVLRLQRELGFQRLHLVAHSMGGLLARAFILQNQTEPVPSVIDAFIGLSTPWNGHAAAGWGVDYAPEAVPSWRDMAPGNDFIEGLFQTDLRPEVRFHLLFSYRGRRMELLPSSNDGTISIASALDPRAQRDAATVLGFDETHVSIIESDEVGRQINALLRGDRSRSR